MEHATATTEASTPPQNASIELSWHNKEKTLVATGDDYAWVDDADLRSFESPRIEPHYAVGHVDMDSGVFPNMLTIGDALDSLQALQTGPYGSGLADRVKLAYLDPPFNVGQGYGHYNDVLLPPMWLSMLRDRLAALKPLLQRDGSVWLHLDDAHAHHGRCLLEEVFGPEAFVGTIVWQKRTTQDSRAAFSTCHDYIHVFSPAGPRAWKRTRNKIPTPRRDLKNPDNDPRGPWADAPFTAPGYRPGQQYDIITPAGRALRPPVGRSWFTTEDVFHELCADNRIYFPKSGAGSPRLKRFVGELGESVPMSIWLNGSASSDVLGEATGTNNDATRHLMQIFPDGVPFATPKPETLLARIIHIATDPGDMVLDCFAGSGTTAAAAHKMGRRWVANERSHSTVNGFAEPRLRKVVCGGDAGGITGMAGWSGGGGFYVANVTRSS